MEEYCCDTMMKQINYKCSHHPNPFDCPDNLIYYNEESGKLGFIIHDGGESYKEINFCPWCGKRNSL